MFEAYLKSPLAEYNACRQPQDESDFGFLVTPDFVGSLKGQWVLSRTQQCDCSEIPPTSIDLQRKELCLTEPSLARYA